MKYIFIINPTAGRKIFAENFSAIVSENLKKRGLEYKIYFSEYKGHIGEIIKEELAQGEKCRFYVAGGDGTLLEAARSCIGNDNAELGIFPFGSGNDYIRQFGDKMDFLDLDRQLDGYSIKVDAISTLEGDALNICSIGLDAAVAYNMEKFKHLPFVNGSMAYEMSLAKCLCGHLGEEVTIKLKTTEGVKEFDGSYIFALAANGQYYGGGYRGAPESMCNDGLLDFVLITKPPIAKIPSMVGIYKKGEHLESENFNGYLTFLRGYEMEIIAKNDVIANRDGECDAVKREHFKIKPKAMNFILPKGIEYRANMNTERLILRPWHKDDFDDFFEIVSNEAVMVPSGAPVESDKGKAWDLFFKYRYNQKAYAIVLKETGKAIGAINYQKDNLRNPTMVNSLSLSYELNENYWGKGYMPEALNAMVENAFETTDIEVLSVGYHNNNMKSKKVIEKCGFVYDGMVRSGYRAADGILYDTYNYSMTREDYLSRKEK